MRHRKLLIDPVGVDLAVRHRADHIHYRRRRTALLAALGVVIVAAAAAVRCCCGGRSGRMRGFSSSSSSSARDRNCMALHVLDALAVVRHQHSAATRGQMRCDWICDHLEQRVGAVCRAYFELLQELHDEAREATECARDADVWMHVDKHVLAGAHKNLEPTGLVERRVEQCEQTLMRDVRTCVRWVALRSREDALMVVRVQQLEPAVLPNFHCLQVRFLQHHKHAKRVRHAANHACASKAVLVVLRLSSETSSLRCLRHQIRFRSAGSL
mmetsp:Transcript_12353/g.33350  ORF Transcript_12353/g.33350 Transcript_12353/m.33350 type:complete len:270 (-) Transcript_12353:58-867(-)